MQIIGVYFIGKLETQLVENFQSSFNERINLLAYNIEQEMKKERDDESPSLEQDIQVTVLGNLKGLVRLGVQTRQSQNIEIAEEELWGKGRSRERQ